MRPSKTWIYLILGLILALVALSILLINKPKGNTMTKSKVYFTRDISAVGIMRAYNALGRPAHGRVALKMHMGEPGNQNYVRPELVRPLVKQTNATFVETNVFYGGPRAKTDGNLTSAREHGFDFAPIDILDADGEMTLPIKNGKHLKTAVLGAGYANYDFIISVAHFKGHEMAGFGGTFKNLAIGLASGKTGKAAIHMDSPDSGQWSSGREFFLEKIADYNSAVMNDMGDNIVYINVLNNLSTSCDCAANAPHPEMADIGIMASLDPVALDRASVDAVYNSNDPGKHHLIERIESVNGMHVLDAAERLGLGRQEYELIDLDK